MPKQARTSDFWRRLTKARESCDPPKSMRQQDLVREYQVSFQSAVTKWKTGGPDGKSLPSHEIIRQMAIDTNVCVDWLITGRGDMRPRPATDPITAQILESLSSLNPEARVEVLKAAIMQQTLQHPAVAAQVKEAQKAAERLSHPKPRKVM